MRALGLTPGAGDAGDRPRPPRRVPLRLRVGRRDVRGGRRRAPPPAAHRGERGAGGVQARPEGLVGDAAQAQPDLGRDDLRARHGCCGRTCRPGCRTWRLWHERDISHSSVERVVLPDSSQLAHYVMRRLTRLLVGTRGVPGADVATTSMRATGSCSASPCCSRWCDAGMTRDEAYRIVQRTCDEGVGRTVRFPVVAGSRPRGIRRVARRGVRPVAFAAQPRQVFDALDDIVIDC